MPMNQTLLCTLLTEDSINGYYFFVFDFGSVFICHIKKKSRKNLGIYIMEAVG